MEIRCSVSQPDAERLFVGFRDAVCQGKSRRYALLCKGSDGIRCKLQNSGRCLDPDTPWAMVKLVVEPLFRFDDGMEWVAMFPVENWKQRCDQAVAASLHSGRAWVEELTDGLAAELPSRPRLLMVR